MSDSNDQNTISPAQQSGLSALFGESTQPELEFRKGFRKSFRKHLRKETPNVGVTSA